MSGVTLDRIIAGIPNLREHAHQSWRFPCTEDHKKRNAPAWLFVGDEDKVRIGCFDDPGHGDALWRQYVAPYLPARGAWARAIERGELSDGQFRDAIIYGPIWPSTMNRMLDLLPIERRETIRRERGYRCASMDRLGKAIAASMGVEPGRPLDPDPNLLSGPKVRHDWPPYEPAALDLALEAAG